MTMSALLDLIPLSLASGFSTHSNVHEILAHHSSNDVLRASQYHECIGWKIPSLLSGDLYTGNITVNDPDCLVRLLFNVYLKMFGYENMGAIFQHITVDAIRDLSFIHYCRRSFSLFVAYLKNRIRTDWPSVASALLALIAGDRLLMVGAHFYQELACDFHMLGIYSAQVFSPNNDLLVANKEQGPFSDWSHVPPVVCVVMEIPPDKMHLLDDTSRVGNPIILAGILGPDLYHTFSSFQASFGKAAFQGSGVDSHVYLAQESSRQDNASPVVISFRVPTWILSNNPRDTSVFVGIQSTPETARQWASNLGLNMRLFAAKLMDTEYVHVVPLTAEGQTFLSTPSVYAGKEAPLTVSDTTTSLVIDEAGKYIKYVKIRSVISGKAKDELARVETDISVEQARQTGLNLKIGSSFIQKLETPFLVDASRSKLRVSRKSSWVEVNTVL